MSVRRRVVLTAAALALVAPSPTGAQAAAPKAKVAVSGPSTVTAGAKASFTVKVTPTKKLKRGTVQLLLSTNKKRDKRDQSLAKKTVRKLKARKAKTLQAHGHGPARRRRARSYRLLACLTVRKATRCVNRA